jgi:hypothetical protein
MNTTLFEELINSHESPTLDFKKDHYKLIGGTEDDLAKFVKDIVSFSNTIRENTAYIILGIEEIEFTKNLIGISDPIDDNILQSKIKDKVYPKPHFSYSNFEHLNKVYGIIEIPIRKHIEPIMPIIKMKGLEVGKVYFRRGSTNVEANGREVIEINNWITNLPDIIEKSEIKTRILEVITKINDNKTPLSVLLTDGIVIGNVPGYEDIGSFCKNEIKGYYGEYLDNDSLINHRKESAYISPLKIDNVKGINGYNINNFWSDLDSHGGFFKTTMFFNESISMIENTISEFLKTGKDGFSTKKVPADNYPMLKPLNYDFVYFYTGLNNFNNVYLKTKQKYLNMLLEKV